MVDQTSAQPKADLQFGPLDSAMTAVLTAAPSSTAFHALKRFNGPSDRRPWDPDNRHFLGFGGPRVVRTGFDSRAMFAEHLGLTNLDWKWASIAKSTIANSFRREFM